MSPRDGILQISDAEEPGLWAGQAGAQEPNGLKGQTLCWVLPVQQHTTGT